MKKWIIFAAVTLFAGSGMASSVVEPSVPIPNHLVSYTNYEEYRMSDELYDALVGIYALKRKQMELRERGFELEEADQHKLNKYQKLTKGTMVVMFGCDGCWPCKKMIHLLEDQQPQGPQQEELCTIEMWNRAGVPFYQIDAVKDLKQGSGRSLSSIWQVRDMPIVFIVKDGIPQARLNGYNDSKASETLAVLKRQVNQYR